MSFKRYKVIKRKDNQVIQTGLCKSAAIAVAIDLTAQYKEDFVVRPE